DPKLQLTLIGREAAKHADRLMSRLTNARQRFVQPAARLNNPVLPATPPLQTGEASVVHLDEYRRVSVQPEPDELAHEATPLRRGRTAQPIHGHGAEHAPARSTGEEVAGTDLIHAVSGLVHVALSIA